MKSIKIIFLTLIAFTLFAPNTNFAQDYSSRGVPALVREEHRVLVDRLMRDTRGKVQIGVHSKTGKVRYIGGDPLNAIRQPAFMAPTATPEDVARGFLSVYGPLFGLRDQVRELKVMKSKKVDRGRSFVRFQQTHKDIPIVGGELIVQGNSFNNIVSANGEILSDIAVDITPGITAEMATEKALELVLKYYQNEYKLDRSSLQVSTPELWIYNPLLLGMNENRTHLVWRMEVSTIELLPIRELVLVDAHLGIVALHFNQNPSALYRKIYDHNNTVGKPLPGNPEDLRRVEGQGPSGIADVDYAYDYAGDTYDFYWSYHGRDSIDNAGMELISTTRFCPSGAPCPYPNAGWNFTYLQMVYGQGYASADDVVAHEMTHGVTQHESNLFYYMQSGAINEAFSDTWGEFVDLTNGRGNDDPGVRWLCGEDLPIGAIRSLSNPPAYNQPDKISSSYYYCGFSDNGGVHYNSGVANKAAYLMTDGGTFNGMTVNGLGITKVAKIFYEVQTNLLTSASDYNDLADALQQACLNLVGTSGITSSDCLQVENAVNATEMNQQPAACSAPEAPLCSCQASVDFTLFFDDLENLSSGNWTHAAVIGGDQWYYPQPPILTYATSGQYNFFGYDYPDITDSYIAMTQNVTLPAGVNAYLHFKHAYSFENYAGYYYDGGVIEYSINNGATWIDAGSLVTHNGYKGAIASGYGNPLAGRSAFVGKSNGYISTRLDLSSLGGQNVRFRFRIGTDEAMDDRGWFIDDIHIYTCSGWNTFTIDNGGYNSSLAADSNNRIHISHSNGPLRYSTNASGVWQSYTVDSVSALNSAIALDSNDNVHISYRATGIDDLKYATNVSGSWVTYTIDSTGAVGGYTSIATDSAGKVHISYFDYTNHTLKYATNASGTWATYTIDSSSTQTGECTSIAIDSNDKVHISYLDYGNTSLKYATNASGSWQTYTIDNTGTVGWWTSIGIDSGGKVHISYMDYGNNQLKYATNASGSWATYIIDTANVGPFSSTTSLAVDLNDRVHISYYTNENLKYATDVSGTWELYEVDCGTEQAGMSTSIATDSNNRVHISYLDYTHGFLKYATIVVSSLNETISAPDIPNGPSIGNPGLIYAFSTGGSSSSLGHSVQYLFDWGDGTNSGWLPVGITSASHSWISPGTYLVKARARCATHSFILSSWSEVVSVKMASILPQTPADNTIFSPCSLITNYQPTFSWTAADTYTGYKILISTSPTDFTTYGIVITKASVSGAYNSWKPSSFVWKNMMKKSYNLGAVRPIYWKIVGTKSDKTTVESEVRSFSIGAPQTVNINAPLDIAILDPAIPPTFDFATNCNTKFKLEISSLSDFSVSTKVKGFSFTVSNPNVVPSLQKTLSSFQWNGVKTLVGTGTGYFRIQAWDGLSRPTVSEVRSFTIK